MRKEELEPPPGSALHAMATFFDHDGELLSTRDAATEVLNVLRPTVAVSVYVVFIAHALHEHGHAGRAWRERLAEASEAQRDELLRRFVQEVRRFYPFFPVVAARTTRSFTWQGFRFPAGRRVVLEVYGTNHDPRSWREPEAFDPDRFAEGEGKAERATHAGAACPRGREADRFAFIPQGGADAATHHRCPGEPISVELMKVAADWLARRMDYQMPARRDGGGSRDGRGSRVKGGIDFGTIPAMPRPAVVLSEVRVRA